MYIDPCLLTKHDDINNHIEISKHLYSSGQRAIHVHVHVWQSYIKGYTIAIYLMSLYGHATWYRWTIDLL